MDMSGPWRFCWPRGPTVNADDKCSNVYYPPTVLWRHLCDDASRRQSTAPSVRHKADAAQSALTGAVAHKLTCLSRMTLTTFTALPSFVKYAARALISATAAVTHAAPAAAMTYAAPAPVANVDFESYAYHQYWAWILGLWCCRVELK